MEQEILAGLIKRGMAPHIAEGFVRNGKDESGLNPTAVGDNGNAFGLFQWNGPRMRALQDFAQKTGRPASDPNVQMDYLMTELQGAERGSWAKISTAKDANEAAVAVLNHFERPAETFRAKREAAYRGGASGTVGSNAFAAGTMQLPQNPLAPQVEKPQFQYQNLQLDPNAFASRNAFAAPIYNQNALG